MDDLDSILSNARKAYSPDPGAQTRVRRGLAVAIGAATVSSAGVAETAAAQGTASQAVGSVAAGGAKLTAASTTIATGGWGLKVGFLLTVVGVAATGYWALEPSPKNPRLKPPVVAPRELAPTLASPTPLIPQPAESQPATPTEPPAMKPDPTPFPNAASKHTPSSVASPRPPSSSGSKSDSSTLLAELDLLKRASGELRSGQPSRALQTLKEHKAKYPRSVLASERRGLSLLAACASAKTPGALRQAKRFLETSPSSPLAPHIKKQCLD